VLLVKLKIPHAHVGSEQVLQLWKLMLLMPVVYRDFCAHLLGDGKLVDHDPAFGTQSLALQRKAYGHTLQAYQDTFAEPPAPSVWPHIDYLFADDALPESAKPEAAGGETTMQSPRKSALVAKVTTPVKVATPAAAPDVSSGSGSGRRVIKCSVCGTPGKRRDFCDVWHPAGPEKARSYTCSGCGAEGVRIGSCPTCNVTKKHLMSRAVRKSGFSVVDREPQSDDDHEDNEGGDGDEDDDEEEDDEEQEEDNMSTSQRASTSITAIVTAPPAKKRGRPPGPTKCAVCGTLGARKDTCPVCHPKVSKQDDDEEDEDADKEEEAHSEHEEAEEEGEEKTGAHALATKPPAPVKRKPGRPPKNASNPEQSPALKTSDSTRRYGTKIKSPQTNLTGWFFFVCSGKSRAASAAALERGATAARRAAAKKKGTQPLAPQPRAPRQPAPCPTTTTKRMALRRVKKGTRAEGPSSRPRVPRPNRATRRRKRAPSTAPCVGASGIGATRAPRAAARRRLSLALSPRPSRCAAQVADIQAHMIN
jgi:hypothetical protein